MTPRPGATAHLTLDPATTDATLVAIFDAQRVNPGRTPAQQQTQREASVALIVARRPRDPVEAAYAARAAAAHYGAMEGFRCAILPDVPDGVAVRWQSNAVALSLMSAEMIRTLEQRQATTPCAQQRPAARAAMPVASPASALAEAARCAASIPAEPVGANACPLDPTDPMSDRRASDPARFRQPGRRHARRGNNAGKTPCTVSARR